LNGLESDISAFEKKNIDHTDQNKDVYRGLFNKNLPGREGYY